MTSAQNGRIGIAMIGYAFMGVAHSQAWRNAPSFFTLSAQPERTVICGRHGDAAADVARRFGWKSVETDWRKVIDRDDVDLVDICTPGDLHAEIAIAALEAGKHVLCEKPMSNTVTEGTAMEAAARAARPNGVRAMVGFTYRRVPAIALAKSLVAEGRLGTVRNVRAQYLQDWLVDPGAPLSWRLQREFAGSGALGDIGAHIIDLVQHITGEYLTGVNAHIKTFIDKRPVAEESTGLTGVAGTELGEVTVDDTAIFLARMTGGGLATFEATRFATGRKNAIRIEINGSDGSLAFDFEDMNQLLYFDGTDDPNLAGYRRILVTEPTHPYVGAWWPPGHLLGYEHAFTHQAVDLIEDIANERDPSPSFADGLQVQRVMAAVEASSSADGAWASIE